MDAMDKKSELPENSFTTNDIIVSCDEKSKNNEVENDIMEDVKTENALNNNDLIKKLDQDGNDNVKSENVENSFFDTFGDGVDQNSNNIENNIVDANDDDKNNNGEINLDDLENICRLKFEDINTNFSEFVDKLILFIYVKHVEVVYIKFKEKSVSLIFKTDYDIFDPKFQKNAYFYHIELIFNDEILPEKCEFKITKASIQIYIYKKIFKLWYSINLAKHDQLGKSKNLIQNSSAWTPCTKAVNHYKNFTKRENYYGFTGIVNLGNTCFMNAVLQCLANTEPLKDYFIFDRYLEDINVKNPLGMKGLFAKEFAQFIKNIWSGKEQIIRVEKLKQLVGEKAPIFASFNQQDAQEFMSFLLDAVHEDLNSGNLNMANGTCSDDDSMFNHDVNDCTSREEAVKVNERLKTLAEYQWNKYKLTNNSIIIDIFCGQFKSVLTCPKCCKKSITFDPFLFVPLSLPPVKLFYHIIYFARDEESDMCKFISKNTIKLSSEATVKDLFERLYTLNVIPKNKEVRLIQKWDNSRTYVKKFNPNWKLMDQCFQNCFSHDNYYSQPLLIFDVKDDDNYKQFYVLQRELDREDEQQVGLPFMVSILKSRLTYSHLCTVLSSYAKFIMNAFVIEGLVETDLRYDVKMFSVENYYGQPSNNSNNINLNKKAFLPHLVYYNTEDIETSQDIKTPFLLRILPPNPKNEEILPTKVPKNDNDDSDSDSDSNDNCYKSENFTYDNDKLIENLENVLYIGMDWITIRFLSEEINFAVELHSLTNQLIFPRLDDENESLDSCLQLFIEPEILDPQNDWCCPNCKESQRASKQLLFWRLPKVIVFQLKRFKAFGRGYNKIPLFVDFPTEGLNLKNYLGNYEYLNENGEKKEPIYDLFAVTNHIGSPFWGHYIACARLLNGEFGWRSFDDNRVTECENIVTSNAYILFYKRRD